MRDGTVKEGSRRFQWNRVGVQSTIDSSGRGERGMRGGPADDSSGRDEGKQLAEAPGSLDSLNSLNSRSVHRDGR